MKYKIYEEIERTYKLNSETDLYEFVYESTYYIKRKGTIFGFMHDVGSPYDAGGGYGGHFLEMFDNLDKAKSFLKCWHIDEYGEKEPMEIIDFVIIKKYKE